MSACLSGSLVLRAVYAIRKDFLSQQFYCRGSSSAVKGLDSGRIAWGGCANSECFSHTR